MPNLTVDHMAGSWRSGMETKRGGRVRVTRCSNVMSVFGQHCRLSGPVGFLQLREPNAIKPAACRAIRDTGVLQIGDRVYMVSMNTTQSYTEYEGGH
jgi:hypothetical protein